MCNNNHSMYVNSLPWTLPRLYYLLFFYVHACCTNAYMQLHNTDYSSLFPPSHLTPASHRSYDICAFSSFYQAFAQQNSLSFSLSIYQVGSHNRTHTHTYIYKGLTVYIMYKYACVFRIYRIN